MLRVSRGVLVGVWVRWDGGDMGRWGWMGERGDGNRGDGNRGDGNKGERQQQVVTATRTISPPQPAVPA